MDPAINPGQNLAKIVQNSGEINLQFFVKNQPKKSAKKISKF